MKTSTIATIAAVVIAVGLIGSVLIQSAARDDSSGGIGNTNVQNVTMENGTQIVEIGVRGGYAPEVSVAKKGLPTVLRLRTQNTFDCSSAIAIPALNYRSYLPQTGVTDIPVPVEQANGTLSGMCSMGMYRFEVRFE